MSALLQVDHLTVRFGASTVVNDVSFHIAAGEKFALVGESGSGKSITALSVLRLVDAATTTGAIHFDGEELTAKSEREMRGIRGARIGMIFQEPMTALNPLYTVGNQIVEVLALHEALRPNAARARAIELLTRTGIPDPEAKVDAYPHQLSGGQRQHVADPAHGLQVARVARVGLDLATQPRDLDVHSAPGGFVVEGQVEPVDRRVRRGRQPAQQLGLALSGDQTQQRRGRSSVLVPRRQTDCCPRRLRRGCRRRRRQTG